MKRGAQDYLSKGGLEAGSLRRAVSSAVEKGTLRRQIEKHKAELESRVLELAESNRALAAREAELRLILRQLPAMVWTADCDLRYTSMTGAARFATLDDRDIVGKRVGSFLVAEHLASFLEAHHTALSGKSAAFEITWEESVLSGHIEPLRDGHEAIRGVIGVALDVADNRALELQLRRSQKMEALGNLAGGVAHDFNNLLTAIVSFAGFVREELPEGDPVIEDVAEIQRAADRGAGLVRQLLAFSRQRSAEARVVEVDSVVVGLLPMLRRVLGEDVRVEFEPGEELWATKIDPGGLEQIVVNMAVNARDAMPRGGRLSIATENVRLHEMLPTSRRNGLEPGDYVLISISDDGIGIPPEIQERVFDPFFTTKGVGSGTGLGLATCYGIARQAGGSIAVYSEVDHGTTFKVYLPRCVETAGSVRPSLPTEAQGGTETILVLEDDPQVRALVVRTLERRGYDVLEAATAEDARRFAEQMNDRIGLVLTDVIMPGASGPEVVAQIRGEIPSARVLYMTGYAGSAIRKRGLLPDDAPVIEKPFTPDSLSRAVRRVLDA
jgi:signal transduction histidine kinase